MNFIPFLVAQPASGGSMYSMLITFGLVFVIFYFFIIRPQNKKQKETEKMITALKKGDKIVTIGGIHGEVVSTKEQTVVVKVDDSCKLEFSRSAIATVKSDEKPGKPAKAAKKEETVESGSESGNQK